MSCKQTCLRVLAIGRFDDGGSTLRQALKKEGLAVTTVEPGSPDDLLKVLQRGWEAVLCEVVPASSATPAVVSLVRECCPKAPILALAEHLTASEADTLLAAGVRGFSSQADLGHLVARIKAQQATAPERGQAAGDESRAASGSVSDVEEAFRHAERERETILDALLEHVVHQDLEQRIVWVNRAGCESVGATREALNGCFCYQVWAQREEPCEDCPVTRAMETGEPRELEKCTPDGRWWFIRGYPFRDDNGNVVGGIEVTQEITERKRATEAIRQSEATLQSIFRAAPVGIGMVTDRVLVHANDKICEMVGRAREELVGSNARILYPTDHEYEEVGRIKYAQVRDRGTGTVETRWQKKDGEVIHVLLSSSPIDLAQPTQNVIFTALDVTEQKRLGEALRRGKREWERTFNTVRELIVVTDKELRIARLNRAVGSACGCGLRELVGRPVAELLGKQPMVADALRELGAGSRESRELEVESEVLGGEFRFTLTPRLDARGNPAGAILVGRDVTERRRIEELLQRQEIVEHMEHIFRTFRHEVGNVLNTVKVTLSVMRKRFGDLSVEKQQEYMERCLESVRLGERLLGAVRRYQSMDRVVTGPLDLGGFLREKEALFFEGALAEGVECSLEPCPIGTWVEADSDALVRVLLNLIENAVAATQGRPLQRIRISCEQQPTQVVLEVSDSGEGIPPDRLARAFTPLYTTKPEGSGMGLAIVQKLMVRMNGLVRVRSEPGEGSVVELRFRRLPAAGP